MVAKHTECLGAMRPMHGCVQTGTIIVQTSAAVQTAGVTKLFRGSFEVKPRTRVNVTLPMLFACLGVGIDGVSR